eukprot:SRR837773.4219.p1 GENE.SRR837773.4219~~SRR837773.4219.p1  ORF type:complete len:421 (+),score=7.80 SRR837773.4219:41-1264(+)
MVGEKQRLTLQSKGYEMVGSHSAVKLCRWTKNALKGRGQCYKHTFYGISSHQCMEATPSLACANKCTFCWRAHTNPVALRWAFDTDDPDMIVDTSLEAHQRRFVRQVVMGGAAKQSRSEEAAEVRHCALSLVGEPVLYPRISELLESLHARRISTFLVTNGQFPEQLEALPRVTQLYVSVDAPDAAELARVGRPLFVDAWERLLRSLDALQAHGRSGCRTVCRLTLRRDGLTREAARGYAQLVRRGRPDFVEAKGVTPVPQFAKYGWSMKDVVPTHTEVREFAVLLQEELTALQTRHPAADNDPLLYALASEHRHSCAALLAREPHWRLGSGWRTWIDFEAFFDTSHAKSEESKLAYSATTPAWAAWNAPEAGLDPEDVPRPRPRPRPDAPEDAVLRSSVGPREAFL